MHGGVIAIQLELPLSAIFLAQLTAITSGCIHINMFAIAVICIISDIDI